MSGTRWIRHEWPRTGGYAVDDESDPEGSPYSAWLTITFADGSDETVLIESLS